MRSKAGILCMILGVLLVLSALGLLLFNQQEAAQAAQASQELLPQLQEQIRVQAEEKKDSDTPTVPIITPEELLTPEDLKMQELPIDGNSYIGILSIPRLELDLPIMTDWDYVRLKISPCRYTGTLMGNDLVILAHNYEHHFGRLKELVRGDSLFFTDVSGATYGYEVMFTDVLPPNSVEEVTSGDFDMTLFTCTYGGENRVVVYCDRADDES